MVHSNNLLRKGIDASSSLLRKRKAKFPNDAPLLATTLNIFHAPTGWVDRYKPVRGRTHLGWGNTNAA